MCDRWAVLTRTNLQAIKHSHAISATAPTLMAVCLMGNVSWMAKVIGIGLIMMLLDETKFKPWCPHKSLHFT